MGTSMSHRSAPPHLSDRLGRLLSRTNARALVALLVLAALGCVGTEGAKTPEKPPAKLAEAFVEALDAEVELADGQREPMAHTMARPGQTLMVAFHLPLAPQRAVHAVFEKVGYRAAFSPARLRMALRWAKASRGRTLCRVAVAAPDLPVHRLANVEALVADTGAQADLHAIRRACLTTLPAPLDPAMGELLCEQAAQAAKAQEEAGLPACLLVPDRIRGAMSRLLRRNAPRLHVLAHSEIPRSHSIQIQRVIGVTP